MRFVKAHYVEATLPEQKGNPLIEALPPKATTEYIMDQFSNYPDLSVDIRDEVNHQIREEYLSRISELRQPLYLYFDCYQAIERALKAGYARKNPFCPTTNQFLHYPIDERPSIAPSTGFFVPKGDGLTLVGDSGLGKTCMLEQVLNYFPHVIEHSKYKNKNVPCKYQVVWIKVDCPTKSSVRELCEEILASLDQAVRQKTPTKPAPTIPKLLRQIEQKIKSSFLGILVIDEMQNLEFSRTGGENNLLKFLHNLVNKLGVPLFFCANPPFDDSLAKTLRNARRAESGGYFNMLPLERHGEDWNDFIEELWLLQWTNEPTELTDELNNKIYELSVGNMDMACRIYREAQRLVIGTDSELISSAVLEYASDISCGLSSRTHEVQVRKQLIKKPRRTKASAVNTELSANRKPRIINDFNRVQHPEFEEQLLKLQHDDKLAESIADPDLVRRAGTKNDQLKYFKEKNILFDTPLQQSFKRDYN